MMSENSRKLLDFLKANNDQNMTAEDIGNALGLAKKTIDGAFTSALQRKGYGVRVPAEVELADGTHKAVKFLHLTDAGMTYDPDAEAAEKA